MKVVSNYILELADGEETHQSVSATLSATDQHSGLYLRIPKQ